MCEACLVGCQMSLEMICIVMSRYGEKSNGCLLLGGNYLQPPTGLCLQVLHLFPRDARKSLLLDLVCCGRTSKCDRVLDSHLL